MYLNESLTPNHPAVAKIAKDELNETPIRITQNLEAIKEWISKQPHINARTDDKFLLGFIRNSKYRLEKAKAKLDTYFTYRTLAPEFYENRDPFEPNIKKLIDVGFYTQLPEPHPDGGRIAIAHINLQELDVSIVDGIRFTTMINDRIAIYDDHLTIVGLHCILDLKGCSMGLATQIIPIASKLVLGIQNAYPIRIKKFHLVNFHEAPSIFQMILRTFRALFKEKIAKRILIHDNMESLYQEIPQKVLPKEYGGAAGSFKAIASEQLAPVLFNSKEWFAEDAKYKTDESKRTDISKTNDLFGTEGSFKKLEID